MRKNPPLSRYPFWAISVNYFFATACIIWTVTCTFELKKRELGWAGTLRSGHLCLYISLLFLRYAHLSVAAITDSRTKALLTIFKNLLPQLSSVVASVATSVKVVIAEDIPARARRVLVFACWFYSRSADHYACSSRKYSSFWCWPLTVSTSADAPVRTDIRWFIVLRRKHFRMPLI